MTPDAISERFKYNPNQLQAGSLKFTLENEISIDEVAESDITSRFADGDHDFAAFSIDEPPEEED